MANTLNPDKALIFRITRRDNLAWIMQHGLHSRSGGAFDQNFRNIGSIDLIDKRSRREVKVGPKGVLNDYIPFYFTPFSIMMYNIHTGYGVPRVPNHEIVIMVASLRTVEAAGLSFIFTDQHAYPLAARYFTKCGDLDEIDWDLLNSRSFRHDPDDPAKKERYQAEALIWKALPIAFIEGFCCFNDDTATHLKSVAQHVGSTAKILVRPDWYF